MSETRFRVFDGHVHVGRWRTPDFSGRATGVADAARLYGALGYFGALVMPTDTADNAGLLKALADADFPFRFCAWVDPEDTGLDALLSEKTARIAALKIHPSFLRRRVIEPAFAPYLDWAAAHHAPVLVHCGRWQEMASYRFVLDVAERHPATAFILCHMGGDGSHLVEAAVARVLETGLTNVSLGTESIREYWIVQRAVDRLGPERIIFGSDYNLNHPRSFQAVIEALELDAEGRRKVFGDNLNALLPPAPRAG